MTKVLLSLGALGVAGAMAGLGTYGSYTSTTSASATVSTGTVHIDLAASGAGNRMSVAATGVLPGDTVSRAVDLSSTSSDALASVKLTTTAPVTSSTLNTDGTNGLQLLIQRCTVSWTETANTAPQTGYSYTCGGTTTTVLGSASTPVIQTNTAFTGLAATAGPGNITPDHGPPDGHHDPAGRHRRGAGRSGGAVGRGLHLHRRPAHRSHQPLARSMATTLRLPRFLRLVLTGVAAVGVAAGAAGLGTLAAGYASQAASSGLGVSTGTVTIGAGTTNRLTVSISNIEPGDTAYRAIDLVSSTTLLSTLTLATTDTYSGAKLSTATTGLQMVVQRCSVAWTEAGSSPAYTYSCGGTTTTLVASRNVLTTTPLSLTGLTALNSGASLPTTDYLVIALTLPTSSASTDQVAQSTINYTFTGVQLTPPKKAR